MSEQAKVGDTISVHYTGRLADGQVFDSSEGNDPLAFVIGARQVIPGFENGVVGLAIGDKKTIEIKAENAYGARVEELSQTVQRELLRMDVQPEIGMSFMVQTPDGQEIPVSITEITEETITLDANHPLAGRDLTFDIEVIALKAVA